MKKRLGSLAVIALGGIAAVALAMSAPQAAEGADHGDSPAPRGEPTADINDLYAWMNGDATRLNLVMTVVPDAADGSVFSDAIVYDFHINSRMNSFVESTGVEENIVRCRFYNPNSGLECWVIDNSDAVALYVEGDPTDPTMPLADGASRINVFAGLRNDPFYFELNGFAAVTQTVRDVVMGGTLMVDAANCPSNLDAATAMSLAGGLSTDDGMSAAADDDFAGQNVLAIVVQIDKTLVNTGGDILGVWASTHQMM